MSPFATLIVILSGASLLLLGNGLFGTLLGVRASLESFGIATTGIIMSAYFLGYTIGSFLCVRAVDRVGHIRTLSAVSAILAATAVSHAILVGPVAWGIFRLVTGTCIVGFFLVIESWLNSITPDEMRGRVFSIYMTVNLMAVASGQFLLTLANPKDFLLFGVVAILFSLSLVPTALAQIDAPAPRAAGGLSLAQLFSASPVGTIGSLTCGFVAGSFWGMGPVLGNKIGLSQSEIATFMSAVILGGMLAQWPIGSISDRVDRRKVIIAVAALGTVAAALVVVLVKVSLVAFLIASAVFGAALFPLYSLAVARTHDVLGTENVLAATRGLVLVFGIGAVFGPLVSGWVMEAFAPLAMFALISGIYASYGAYAVYRVPRGETVPAAEQSAFVPLIRTSQEAIEIAQASNLAKEEDE